MLQQNRWKWLVGVFTLILLFGLIGNWLWIRDMQHRAAELQAEAEKILQESQKFRERCKDMVDKSISYE